MCSNEWLKFCTCSTGPVDKTKPYWVLYSSNRGDEIPSKREGTINIPTIEGTLSLEDFSVILIDKLKSSSLFDFDYEAKEGDIISIRIPNMINLWTGGKIKTNLMFEMGEWCDLLYSMESINDFYVKTIESGPLSFRDVKYKAENP